MFDKLMALQQQTEEMKKRLETISVSADVENGAIRVVATAGKKIQTIEIENDFFDNAGKEAIEELIQTAVNKALEKAEEIQQTEMQAASREMMNQMGGLGALAGLFNK